MISLSNRLQNEQIYEQIKSVCKSVYDLSDQLYQQNATWTNMHP